MKAMILHRTGPVESSPLALEELPVPQPAPHHVRVRIRCCAICRTDLHIIENELPPPVLPLVPGHQAVGHVDALGEGCRRLGRGMRVGIAWLGHTCGTCRFCLRGRENLCADSLYSGYHTHGGYAQYAVIHEDFAHEIPADFDDVSAAPLLCAGVIGYRALLRSALPPEGRLALFGFGSSAHIVLQLAVRRGHEVYVVSRSAGHQQLARDLGATWAGSDPRHMPHAVDSAIVFAPAGNVVPGALESLLSGGTVALAGIHMTPIPELDYARHLYRERDIHPVMANTRADAAALLKEASAAHITPRVRTYRLEQANEALADMKAGRIDGTGVLLTEG